MSLRKSLVLGILGMGLSVSAWAQGCPIKGFNAAAGIKTVDIEKSRLDKDQKMLASLGPQVVFADAGEGYSQGTLANGRHVGLKFDVAKMPDCSLAANKPVAYDLDDPSQSRSFNVAVNKANLKQQMADHPIKAMKPALTR